MTVTRPKVDFSGSFRFLSEYDKVRDAIVFGKIEDGCIIKQETLFDRFEISQESGIDILNDLGSFGFIKYHEKAGTLIVCYNSTEAAAIGRRRLKLEKVALKVALKDMYAIDIEKCRKLLDKFTKSESLSSKFCHNEDMLSHLYFGRDFDHRYSKTDNTLRKHGKYLYLLWSDEKQVEAYRQDLHQILDLCYDGKASDTLEAVSMHIARIDTVIVESLSGRKVG